MRAQGVDIARYEIFFLPETARQRIDFAIQKLTEGISYVDTALDALWTGVAQIPVRGGYHYQRSGYPWQAQADHYLNVAGRKDYHIHALDLEEIGNVYSDTFFADSRRIVDYWRQQTGQRVLLYTNWATYVQFAAAIKRQYSDAQAWLDALDFWYAWPSTASNPTLPTGRNTWRVWQYSWTGAAEDWGTANACDVNYFNGTIEELQAWAGLTTVPPPTGGTMKGLMKNYVVNVRDAVGNVVTQLRVGDAVYGEVYRDNRERIRFSKIYRAAGNIENLGRECNAVTNDAAVTPIYYMTLTNEAEPTPEPPPPPDPEPGVTITGVRYSGEVVFDYSNGTQEVWHISDAPLTKGPA